MKICNGMLVLIIYVPNYWNISESFNNIESSITSRLARQLFPSINSRTTYVTEVYDHCANEYLCN